MALTAALSSWNHQGDGRLVSEAVPQARDASEAARGCYEQLKSWSLYLETKRVPMGDKVAARSVIAQYEGRHE